MDDIIQYRKVLEIEFLHEDDKMRIYHLGGEARYVDVDLLKLNQISICLIQIRQ